MPSPSPRNLLLLLFVFGFFMAVIQLGLLRIAFDKLGLSASSAYLLLISSLMGSLINLPLFTLRTEGPPPAESPLKPLFPGFPAWRPSDRTLITFNVGGGMIPLVFSIYLFRHSGLTLLPVLQGVFFVSLISYLFSRPIKGLGIGMPMLIAPLSAALAAVLIAPEASAPLAYISGTLGVLIGADLLRLKDIRTMGAPFASIGGAGTFDGIFITGIVAVLLA
ncbi:MAG: DUF1614 domain-containing protein [Gammaproteobacteria bacterium]|nr:DUF1614 domain-containing protein [Gammaproteobacteria bacterium]